MKSLTLQSIHKPGCGGDNILSSSLLMSDQTLRQRHPASRKRVHGGGEFAEHGKGIGSLVGQTVGEADSQLARTGDYAALGVGYRLNKEAHWPAPVHDCKAAIRWIRAHAKELNLEANKIACGAVRRAGPLSSLLGTSGDVNELEGDLGPNTSFSSSVQCVVNLCGPEDFTQALMFTQEGQPIWKDNAVSGLLGGSAADKTAGAKAALPLAHVSKEDPPFITFHGTKDQRVAFRHPETIHAALQKAGVTSPLVPITGDGHGSVNHPEVKVRGQQFTDKIVRGIESAIDTTPLQTPPEVPKKAP